MKPAIRALTAIAALIACVGVCVAPSHAATYRLDDSASQTVPPNAQMQWRSTIPGSTGDNDVESRLLVNVRIDTRAWVGHTGRIYMVLPMDSGPRVSVQWQTQGRLLAGRLQSGERTLVYAGTIAEAKLEDQMQVYLRTDGRWMTNMRRLSFYFELDTD